ncbi:MAG: AraC family transcriptional regulator [Bacillota bacterium]
MNYQPTLLNEEIIIKKVVSVHYFEFAKDYVFSGEKHDFWEFLYVDKGEAEVMADTQGLKLKQGEMIFHKPNEFHNVWANGRVAPNIVIVAFCCKSKAMRFFENKIISVGDVEKNLMAQIIREAKEAFSSPLNVSELEKLERRPRQLFGSEQLIKLYLEQLMIYLVRKGGSIKKESRLSSTAKERSDEDRTRMVINYLQEHINDNLRFEDVCQFSNLSKTNLKTIFKEKTGASVMEYFKNLKIEEAKKLIREGECNITEIAERLGFTTIHYFSRRFKQATGMTPSEYASSVQVKI